MIDSGFVVSTVSTRSLFSITSVFPSFRSFTHLPTTRIRMGITRTDTADTGFRAAAMAMDPQLCSCSRGVRRRENTLVALMGTVGREHGQRIAASEHTP